MQKRYGNVDLRVSLGCPLGLSRGTIPSFAGSDSPLGFFFDVQN